MSKKILALLLAAAMVMSVFAGCGGKAPEKTPATEGAGANAPADVPAEAPAEFSYPMEPGDTLTYWGELPASVAPNFTNLGDTEFGKGLQAATGVSIEFLHPASGQTDEQFALIMTDEVLPDMMEYNWATSYPGGPEKAISDGVIIPLNDVFEKYCPNITAYLAANPEIDKMIKTDEGNYYVFPFIRGDERLLTTVGLMVRGDWLEELGLEVPTTIDEWYTVLKAFKEEKGAVTPLSYESTGTFKNADPFAAAYETHRSFYLGSDGKIHYGAVEQNYKAYLETMHKWHSEGLLDPDFASLKSAQVGAKITTGEAGASMGYAGSRMGVWIPAGREADPDYTLIPAPVPTLKEGERAEFGFRELVYSGKNSVAITTSCKDVERAARLLDWAFGEAGHLYYNFGTEGESYTMIDGYPTYTDKIMNHPDMPVAQAMAVYIRGNYNGPFVQDYRYLEQYYTIPEQLAAPVVWADNNGSAHLVPAVTPTSEESKEYATIMSDIEAYRNEMILKFITGQVSLDQFDEYVKTIEGMGLARALEIQNAALDRYNAR